MARAPILQEIETVPEAEEALGGSVTSSRVASMAAAAAALSGVAAYFGRLEPSSPALLLVRQAEHLLGKSFAEAIHMLVPAHAENATINVGRGWSFDLSVDRMAALLDAGTSVDEASANTSSLPSFSMPSLTLPAPI